MLFNTERHKELISDADKLLALTNALKAEVAQMKDDVVTPSMTKKVEEIAKLAQKVQQNETQY